MENKIKTDAVLLDVDGTLWNTTSIVAKAWNEVFDEMGIDRHVNSERLKTLFGKPMDEIAAEVLEGIDPKRREEISRKCLDREEEHLAANTKDISYPGVRKTIEALSKIIPVCIVSNCQAGYIELAMDKIGLKEFVTDRECFGVTGKGKAENIRLVCGRNGFTQAVYVGDIQRDLDASREAGVRFIHAAYGFGTADAPDAVVSDFSDLLSILEKSGSQKA